MNKERLKKKVAIVTGGGFGIGKAIAFDFAKEGALVVACDIDQSSLKQVGEESVRKQFCIRTIDIDITQESEVEKMVKAVLEEFGKIDILVNNAGVNGPQSSINEITKEQWDHVLNTNLTGMFLCAKAVLKPMVTRGEGNIINLSSGAGLRGSIVRRLPYAVSKFGVEGFTYALAQQVESQGICVNAMRPAPTATRMAENLPPERRKKLREPREISKLAVFLALQTVNTMTGQSLAFLEWEKKEGE